MTDETKEEGQNVSDLLVECLKNEGVEFIFGLPGEENAEFAIALNNHVSEDLRFILVRHEQAAAFMCDVYGRLTGKPAVCFGTLGPGATNLVTGIADANMDRSPAIVITGQADTERLHKESHQNMSVLDLFEPITNWNCSILKPSTVPEIVRKAFKIATTEKPGVCHIELPEDVAGELVPDEIPAVRPLPVRKVRRPVPDDKVMNKIWSLLLKSKKPVIIAGNGCVRTRVAKQLREFCEKTKIPVVSTFMAKGAVNCDAQYCCFTAGLQSGDFNQKLIHHSDLIISLGFDFVEYHPQLWNPKGDKRIVHIDFLPAEVDAHYNAEVEAVGDLGHAMWMLNEKLRGFEFEYDNTEALEVRQKMLNDFGLFKDDETEGLVKPQKVLWDVRQELGPCDILLSDVGAHKMWIARYYQCNEPNTCLISNGFCSMGFALPGAIAAKLTYPDRKVLAIMGDGGFLMNVQEMETAKREKVNIVVMVWVDNAYGLIAWKQENRFGKHTPLAFTNPDFLKLADAFGWNGYYVRNSADLKQNLHDAFECGNPALIAVDIDYSENSKLTDRLGAVVRCL